jgi:putative ABC transport system substrate-binding protein
MGFDPVAWGLSLAAASWRNVTGTSGMFSEAAGKRLELLNEAVPGGRRIAVLWNPANRVFQSQMLRETEAAARPLGIQLQVFEARDPASIETAFAAISKERPGVNVPRTRHLRGTRLRIAALERRRVCRP